MTPATDGPPPAFVCVSGAPADADGVCTEHGETACVVGAVPLETAHAGPDEAPAADETDPD